MEREYKMYSKYDPDLKMLMIGFSPERLQQLISILETYGEAEIELSQEAKDMRSFLEVSKLAMTYSNMVNK